MASRTFRDPEGGVWQVWQVLPGQQLGARAAAGALLPDDMADGWLTFESASEKRRVYPIPDGWMEYSDDDLWALCRAAVPVAADREAANSLSAQT